MSDTGSHSNRIYIVVMVRCYAELNDFISEKRKYKTFALKLKKPAILSEAITGLGIPLSEVDLILVNSQPAGRSHKLSENDYISVYPVFETFNISGLKKSPKRVLRQTKFIADAHLGKLTKYLRMLGFDTLYRNDFGDQEIINISLSENRIILTRDKQMLNSKQITHGYFVRAIDKHKQLIEVIDKFDLIKQFKPFTRCMTCNTELISKTPGEVINLIDKDTVLHFKAFYYCPVCTKVFWEGSHFKRMESLILKIAGRKDEE